MTRQEIEAAISKELNRIAPEIDMDDIDRGEDLREEFDIDSMDFLNLVTALGKIFRVEIPEAEYGQIGSFNALVDYMAGKVAT